MHTKNDANLCSAGAVPDCLDQSPIGQKIPSHNEKVTFFRLWCEGFRMPAHERRLSRCKTRACSITNVGPMAPRMITTRCSKEIGGDASQRSLRRSRIPGSHPLTHASAGSLLPPIELSESAAEPDLWQPRRFMASSCPETDTGSFLVTCTPAPGGTERRRPDSRSVQGSWSARSGRDAAAARFAAAAIARTALRTISVSCLRQMPNRRRPNTARTMPPREQKQNSSPKC